MSTPALSCGGPRRPVALDRSEQHRHVVGGRRAARGRTVYGADAGAGRRPRAVSATTSSIAAQARRPLRHTLQGEFRYVVDQSFVVRPDQVEVLDPTEEARLTLTTCNPRYSARERLIVSAVLVGEPAASSSESAATPPPEETPPPEDTRPPEETPAKEAPSGQMLSSSSSSAGRAPEIGL